MVKETFQGQAKQASALASGVKKISAAQRSKKFPQNDTQRRACSCGNAAGISVHLVHLIHSLSIP
jgi:hypothetical protein